MELRINEYELKAAVYDYIMSQVMNRDFEDIAAVAHDVLKIAVEIGTKEND